MRLKKLLGIIVLALPALVLALPSAWANDAPLRLADADPGTISALRVDPSAPATVFAATGLAGVLKTTDGGATWVAKNTGLPTVTINDLAITPSDPTTIYIATALGGFRSIDGGETWTALDLGVPNLECTALALDPDSPEVVLMGTAGNGPFYSPDFGQTWESMGSEETARITAIVEGAIEDEQAQISSFRKSRRRWYVTTEDGTTAYTWRNNRWEKTTITRKKRYTYSALPSRRNIKRNAESEQSLLYVGLHEDGIYEYVTVSDGSSSEWRKIATPAGTENVNGLSRWVPVANGDTSLSPRNTVQDTIYAASYDGFVMKGIEEAEAWSWTYVLEASLLGLASIHPRTVTAVAVPGSDVPALWVGTFSGIDEIGPHAGRIYYSPDDGATWTDTLAGGYFTSD